MTIQMKFPPLVHTTITQTVALIQLRSSINPALVRRQERVAGDRGSGPDLTSVLPLNILQYESAHTKMHSLNIVSLNDIQTINILKLINVFLANYHSRLI